MVDIQEAFYRLAPHLMDSSVQDDGTISFADRRFVFLHTKMVAELFSRMEEVAGPVIRSRIELFGEEAGLDIAAKMDEEFRDVNVRKLFRLLKDSGFDVQGIRGISPTDPESQMEKIFGYGTHVGWVGYVDIESYEEGEEAIFSAENTFESDSYGTTGNLECRFIKGVLKGIVAYFWDQDVSIEETSCACEDEADGHCRFEVTA